MDSWQIKQTQLPLYSVNKYSFCHRGWNFLHSLSTLRFFGADILRYNTFNTMQPSASHIAILVCGHRNSYFDGSLRLFCRWHNLRYADT